MTGRDDRDTLGEGAFAQALDWHLRMDRLDGEEWRAFADWLDADPANAKALARVDAIDDTLCTVTMTRPLSVARATLRWQPRSIAGGMAVAAGLAAIVFGAPWSAPVTQIITRAGEIRVVDLGDGSRATLNGATLLRYSGRTPRSVEIVRGEAVFSVRHDAANPFRVTVRDHVIEDVGTVFNVTSAANMLDVSVAEGSVTFIGGRTKFTLAAGRALRLDAAAGTVTLRPTATASVGGWRTGLLGFDSVRLADVAAALERRSGARLDVDRGLMTQPFTGSVRVSGDADRDVPHLAALIGANARHDGKRWILSKAR